MNTILTPVLRQFMIQHKDELIVWAAGVGHEPMVKLLLREGADRARVDSRLLIVRGAALDSFGLRGMAPLHWAAILGDEPMARLFGGEGV